MRRKCGEKTTKTDFDEIRYAFSASYGRGVIAGTQVDGGSATVYVRPAGKFTAIAPLECKWAAHLLGGPFEFRGLATARVLLWEVRR